MPPKRGRPAGRGRGGTPRAASRARGTPGPSGLDGSRESQSPAPSSSETRARVRTPGPAKYSTSYGSPATLTAFRRVNAGSAIGSIGSALDNIQNADEEDRQSRTARLAAEAKSRGGPAPRQLSAQSPPPAEEEDSDNDSDRGLAQASRTMPPPPLPLPSQSQRLTRRSASAANTASDAGRLGSEPLHSDVPTPRSFIEESEIYGVADLATPTRPRTSAQPINVPQNIGSPAQPALGLRRSPRRHQQSPSPTRAAAPISVRTGADRANSLPPATSRPPAQGSQRSHALVNISDSLDEEDEEDPLHNPTPRGVRSGRGLSATSQSQGQSQAVHGDQRPDMTANIRGIEDYVGPNRNMNPSSSTTNTNDQAAIQASGVPENRPKRRLKDSQQTRGPNPIRDARSGDLLLPRPDRGGSPLRPEGDSTADPVTGFRNPAIAGKPRSMSPNIFSGSSGQPSQQSNLGRRQPDGPPPPSPPQAHGNSTAGSAAGSRMSATLGQPRSPSPASSSSVSSDQSSQQSNLGRRRPDGPFPPPPQAQGGSTASGSRIPGTSEQSAFDQLRNTSPFPSPLVSPASSFAGQTSQQSSSTDQPSQRSSIFGFSRLNLFSGSRNRQAPHRANSNDQQQHQATAEGLLTRVFDWLRWVSHLSNWPLRLRKILEFYAIFVLLCWGFLIMLEICLPTKRWEGIQVGKDYQYYGMSLENWRQNILQFVPWIVLHPFATLTGNLDYADFRDQLSRLELKGHSNSIKMNSIAAATNQMRRVLPELIKINVGERRGDWTIDEWFWHVLNEEMTQGSFVWSLLTITKSEDGSYTISDTHWNAIKQRIQNERLLVSDRPVSGEDPLALSNEVMRYVEQSVSQAFQDWLVQNEKDVRRLMGKNEGIPSATYKDLYGDVEKIVAERLDALGLQEGVVTKDTFIEKMEHEFDQRESYIKTEMKNLHEKLGQALEIAIDAKNSAEPPPGMSRHEVSDLVDESVRRAIADAQLEAMAKGSIKSHLKNELNLRKNYFSALRGAVVDPRLTSGTYDWRPQQVVKQESWTGIWSVWGGGENKQPVYREGGRFSGMPFAPALALERWEEDGECWCAGHGDPDNITRVADLSIFTTEPVVPQHLVIEHIGRGATFDPEAMPKDIEFWIQPPPDKRARTLYDWSKSKWADIKYGPGAKLVNKGFLKVGEFQFDAGIGKGESQVFKLSEELLGMDAQTRQVLVRAKSNYGAKDHTCFYRLRLFGEEGRGRNADTLY